MRLVDWMNGGPGRSVRAAVGVALAALGLAVGGVGGAALVLVGMVPLMAGATGRCLIAPVVARSPRRR